MASSTFNLAKGIMGAGAIALPGSVSAIGDVKSAVWPTFAILVVMGCFSAYTFSMIGAECERNNAATFDEAWAATVGEKSKWILSSSLVITTYLACLAYSMIIGDLFSALTASAGATGVLAKRSVSILGITGIVVVPLCFLKSLAALQYTSILGVIGVVFTTVVMGIRSMDGSYLPTGAFFASLPAVKQPLFDVKGCWKLDEKAFVLISCLSTAFLTHFNAPVFYNELENKSMPRFNKVIASAFSISTLVFAGLIGFGFRTFGENCLGNILNNYAATDGLASLCRIAIGFSIVFTYPLAFTGLKNGLLGLLNMDNPTEAQSTILTLSTLASITAGALVLQDLGFVAAITGSLMGSLIIYVFPGLMRLGSLKNFPATASKGQKLRAWGLVGLGSMLGCVGVTVSILKQFTNVLA